MASDKTTVTQKQQPTVLGIAGGSGSGKSTLVKGLLASSVGGQITILKHDDYYRNHSDMPEPIRTAENWDHPESIDNDLFVSHLIALKQGGSIESPQYDFATHSRRPETLSIEAKPIIIVEGILIFAIPAICDLLDWRIYLEASPDERVLRRIIRDTRERGRTLESVVMQYRTTTRVMHDEWIEPSREHAHFLIPTQHDRHLTKTCEFLECFLQEQLRRSA
ncbi:uridine kinase [Pirellulaceae bacterium SH449]